MYMPHSCSMEGLAVFVGSALLTLGSGWGALNTLKLGGRRKRRQTR
jgi:hypothetical protein